MEASYVYRCGYKVRFLRVRFCTARAGSGGSIVATRTGLISLEMLYWSCVGNLRLHDSVVVDAAAHTSSGRHRSHNTFHAIIDRNVQHSTVVTVHAKLGDAVLRRTASAVLYLSSDPVSQRYHHHDESSAQARIWVFHIAAYAYICDVCLHPNRK